MIKAFPEVVFQVSLLAVAFGYVDFECREYCFQSKMDDHRSIGRIFDNITSSSDWTVEVDNITSSSDWTVEVEMNSNMAEFLFTAPCPPIWNFTLACNYFSRDTISREESTAILKRCLDFYDTHIPCNTTIEVIEQCMSENSTMCESLIHLYHNYCNNTCSSHCDEDEVDKFTEMLHTLRKTKKLGELHRSDKESSQSGVDYFPESVHHVNSSDTNNTHIKIIRAADVRTPVTSHTCGYLCIILLIGGFLLFVAFLGCILCCVVRRFHKDDKSYRVHSKDKCVGPDDSGIRADSALLPGVHFKEDHPHIPRRYRHLGVQDTSFIHTHHCSSGTSRLLRGPIPGVDIDMSRI